jgi:hypothetical protein
VIGTGVWGEIERAAGRKGEGRGRLDGKMGCGDLVVGRKVEGIRGWGEARLHVCEIVRVYASLFQADV